MKSNNTLAIVIPTFNRASFLDHCLELLSVFSADYGIRIYVSDNASDDDTEAVVQRWCAVNPLISYHRNAENVGERNFEIALQLPQTRYVWLLGDTYTIPRASLEYVLNWLEKPQCSLDMVVLNLNGRVRDVQTQTYTDCNLLLRQLGWHMTCLSGLVYSRKLLEQARFDRYRDTNFIQTGVVFEYLDGRPFTIHWTQENSVGGIALDGHVKESWRSKAFDIWVNRWVSFVLSLPPSYALQSKLECIGAHGPLSGLFTVGGLANLRIDGVLHAAVVFDKRHLWKLVTRLPMVAVLLVSVTPKWLLKAMRSLRNCRRSGQGPSQRGA